MRNIVVALVVPGLLSGVRIACDGTKRAQVNNILVGDPDELRPSVILRGRA